MPSQIHRLSDSPYSNMCGAPSVLVGAFVLFRDGFGWFATCSESRCPIEGRARGRALGFGVTTPTSTARTTHVRVSTAFNRLLDIPGAMVTDVVIGGGDIEVALRPTARLLRCLCGKRVRAVYDRRRRRWRHLDLGANRCVIECELRRHRLLCPRLRRDQLPPRPALPHLSRRPADRRDRVVLGGPQRRHIPALLRRARRPPEVDPGGFDRHERRL